MKDFIKINENDNVIVAIKELAEGEKVAVDGKNTQRLRRSLPDTRWRSVTSRRAVM